MSFRLKPYPAMKNSGVPWLGAVPKHWEVRRLKHEARINPSKSEAAAILAADADVTFLPMERVGTDGRIDTRIILTASQVWNGLTYFRKADVIVAKITPCFENGKGACLDTLPTSVGFGSTEFTVLRATPKLLPQFLYRITTIPDFRTLGADAMMGAAGQQRVPQSFIGNFPAVVPPLPEQSAIVGFLDQADKRIRRFIAAKRRLIELLNEQKQAIIQKAVTRGLDPTVRLKPSGFRWLGDVPSHWQVLNLGRCLSRIEQGWSPVAAEGELDVDQYAVLTLSSVRRGQFCPTAIKPVEKKADVPKRIEVLNGDFLLTRSNTRDRVGDVCIVRGVRPKTILCDLIYRLSAKKELVHSSFLMYALLAPLGRGQIERDARGSSNTMPKLSQRHITSWRIALPPVDEQVVIAYRVESSLVHIDSAASRAEREIALLREYRTRLIADVVTGKLDVRGVELPPLEEAEELPAVGDEAPEEESELEPVEEGADTAD